MHLSSAVRRLQPSATMAAAAKAKELKNRGVQVFDFTLGEPDFLTPPHIRKAAKQAMDSGATHYTPATGIPELKQAICDAYERDHGLKFAPNQVAVSNGAKHCIHNVLAAMIDPMDEVIIPAPYWVSYSALVELCGGVPVILPTSEAAGFTLSPGQLRDAITDRTRLLMLNNPSNPTGATYPLDTLESLVRAAVEHNIPILSDEIYEKLIYDGAEFKSVATFGDDVAANTIIVNGVSKAYAMTGWRIGWTIASPEFTAAITRLQSQQTSNPCAVSQHAAIAALTGPQDCVEEMRAEFAIRRTFVLDALSAMPGISMAKPGGAFYAFFNVSEQFREGRANSTEFCESLLEDAHVALVTGDAFGAPGYVRLSFASDMKTLEAGLDRLEGFLHGG